MTSCGLNYGPLAGRGTYPAVICCNLTNGKMPHTTEAKDAKIPYIVCKNGERIITEVENNTMIGYKYFSFDNVKTIGITVRDLDNPKGKILIRLSENGEAIAEIPLQGAREWTTFSTAVSIENGTYPLYFIYTGEGEIEVKDICMQ